MERAVILPGLIIAAASSNLLSDRILFWEKQRRTK
jgi:hypothetical protein